ncbi:MAG: HNH endonuclease [Rhodocyclales bacterium]|nr:HNH endonuclease [Rhodocyclales bacterium]
MEVHHIDELSEGGLTEYENLIVLCPNCHTRVHSTGVPGKPELRQYKLKQELLYGLPVLSRLTKAERTFVALLAKQSPESQLLFSTKDGIRYELDSTGTPVLAQAIVDEYGSLLEFGMVSINRGICVQDSTGNLHAVDASLQVTDKGLRWVRYLVKAGKLPD